jgi:Na+/H+ antiporter NhaA
MSLFIGGLAFGEQAGDRDTQVRLGVLGGSLVSALLGVALLLSGRAAPPHSRDNSAVTRGLQ